MHSHGTRSVKRLHHYDRAFLQFCVQMLPVSTHFVAGTQATVRKCRFHLKPLLALSHMSPWKEGVYSSPHKVSFPQPFPEIMKLGASLPVVLNPWVAYQIACISDTYNYNS